MQTLQLDYFTAYRSLMLTRDTNGVLVAEFHNNGGPLTFTAQAHTEVADAFYRISQDRGNKIVILTGPARESLLVSIGHLLVTSPIPAFGARFTTKASKFWKT